MLKVVSEELLSLYNTNNAPHHAAPKITFYSPCHSPQEAAHQLGKTGPCFLQSSLVFPLTFVELLWLSGYQCLVMDRKLIWDMPVVLLKYEWNIFIHLMQWAFIWHPGILLLLYYSNFFDTGMQLLPATNRFHYVSVYLCFSIINEDVA